MIIDYIKNAKDAIHTIKALKQNPDQKFGGYSATKYKTGIRTLTGYLKKSGISETERLDWQSVSFLRKNIDPLYDAVSEIERIESELQVLREQMLKDRVQPAIYRLLESEGEVL